MKPGPRESEAQQDHRGLAEIQAMLDPQDPQENREQKDQTEQPELVVKLDWRVFRVPRACWVPLVPPAHREPLDWMDRKDNWAMEASRG